MKSFYYEHDDGRDYFRFGMQLIGHMSDDMSRFLPFNWRMRVASRLARALGWYPGIAKVTAVDKKHGTITLGRL